MTVAKSRSRPWDIFRRWLPHAGAQEDRREEPPERDASLSDVATLGPEDRSRQEALLKTVIESFHADSTFHPISLSEACAEVVENYHCLAEAKSVSLRVDVRLDPHLRFLTDAVRLRQIVASLVENAIRFTDRSTMATEVDIVRQTQDEATIRISVSDTGVGISEASLSTAPTPGVENLDEAPFHQAAVGGGLATCVKSVNRLGGTISVESHQGHGTRLVVELTLKTLREADRATAVANDLTGLHVLIVEDNAVNQLILKRILEQQACRVDVAENGWQAVEWLRSNRCDIVLMDCQMPEMDGFEATRHIRQLGWPIREVPIIAVTANSMSGDRQACLEAGMNDYISKPIRREALTNAIRKLVFARS